MKTTEMSPEFTDKAYATLSPDVMWSAYSFGCDNGANPFLGTFMRDHAPELLKPECMDAARGRFLLNELVECMNLQGLMFDHKPMAEFRSFPNLVSTLKVMAMKSVQETLGHLQLLREQFPDQEHYITPFLSEFPENDVPISYMGLEYLSCNQWVDGEFIIPQTGRKVTLTQITERCSNFLLFDFFAKHGMEGGLTERPDLVELSQFFDTYCAGMETHNNSTTQH